MPVSDDIRDLEAAQGHSFTNQPGLWQTNRDYILFRRPAPDNNLFYSALITHYLDLFRSRYAQWLSPGDQSRVNRMCQRFYTEVPRYRNKHGRLSWNFWETQPSNHFPNGWLLRRFDYLRLPDDADDTALTILSGALNHSDGRAAIMEIHRFANDGRIRRVPVEYRGFRAFTTFMGVRTPAEFDVCVMCNVLIAMHRLRMERTPEANDSLRYIETRFTSDRLMRRPFQLAPNYPHRGVILYHLSRLIAETGWVNTPLVTVVKNTLDLSFTRPGDRFFQHLSRCLLGLPNDVVTWPLDQALPYFGAGMLSSLTNGWLEWLAAKSWTHLQFNCPDFARVLNIYFQLIHQRRFNGSSGDS